MDVSFPSQFRSTTSDQHHQLQVGVRLARSQRPESSFRDYTADKTKVICNPRGYGGERNTSGFRPGFVIDL